MTRPRRRRFRLVWQPDTEKPWIIQYDDGPQAWKDAYRFRQNGEAHRFLRSIRERDKALLEAER